MHSKKEGDLAYRFYNKMNHLNIISNQELPSLKNRKLLWYKLVTRKIKKKKTLN